MNAQLKPATTSYIVGTDTVTDSSTDLMWSKDLGVSTHNDAEKLIAQANADKVGGFDDWRMPTVKELFGIVDHERYSPACDPAFSDMKSDFYWTSTADASDKASFAWAVYFGNGYVYLYNRHHRFRVRAVRSARQ